MCKVGRDLHFLQKAVDSEGQIRPQEYGSIHVLTRGQTRSCAPLCPKHLYTNVTHCHKRLFEGGIRTQIRSL